MKIFDLYKDYNIQYVTEGSKHCRDGWVNIACPFCSGNPGYHLGYNTDGDYFHCWRCGGKFKDQVLVEILGVTQGEAQRIIKKYGGSSFARVKEKPARINLTPYQYPTGKIRLARPHREYLESREFDPDYLEKEWHVKGTGPLAFLDGANYSRRVLAPIFWEGKEVTFQCRTILEGVEPKYMACPMARENIHHQHILYGDQLHWGERGVCVEGITDVWRMGKKSCGVFGIDYTPHQVKQIAKHFKEVIVLFDPEPQARKQANKLVAELRFRGVSAWREDIQQDPGSLSQEEANYLMKQLIPK